MRVYYLRFTRSDFLSTINGRWETPVVDLYQNNWYKNFSTLKARGYGINALGNNVWTGMEWVTVGSQTDSGVIQGGRFIDTSGPVDIVNFVVESATETTLDVYVADSATSHFPDEWVATTGASQRGEINLSDQPRFAKFVLNGDLSDDVVLNVRIEIGPPVMTPMYAETRGVLDKFPKWMALREFENQPATPATATPVSVGGKLINAISGEWLDDVRGNLGWLNYQPYIDTVDLSQKAWVYRTDSPPAVIHSITGNGIGVGRALTLRELLEADDDEHVMWWDEGDNVLYSNQPYDTLLINGGTYTQEPHQTWNYVDEIGLSIDLPRLPLEDNATYKQRILDVYRNPPGVGIEQFKLALRRELNLWKYMATPATPDSNYVGATPSILEIPDIEEDVNYVDADGLPTDKFIKLVDQLSKQYPTTWGRFKWDKALWDISGDDFQGYANLPYRMDATPLQSEDTQSGVGDGNDLFVYKPDVVVGPHEFQAQLRIRGRQRTTQTEFPPLEFDFSIFGQADRKVYTNPPTTVWFTLEAQTLDPGAPTYTAEFQMTATSDVDVDKPVPTSSSWATQDIFDQADFTTLPFYLNTSGAPYYTVDGKIPALNINTMTLRRGRWDVGSQSYQNAPGDVFTAWLSTNPAGVVTYNAGSPSFAPASSGLRPSVQMASTQTSYVIGKWLSTPINYTLRINDLAPFNVPNPVSMELPVINWDNYLEATPNKQYVVQLNTKDGSPTPNYGVTLRGLDGVDTFLPSSYLQLNANSTWTGGNTKYLNGDGSITQVTFSSGTGASYPIQGYVWVLFERQQNTTLKGVVDENGPWRNGEPQASGSTNYTFTTANVTRNDFGIPNTADYVPTWVGVDVAGDPQVIAWLDKNTITSAVPNPYTLELPAAAGTSIQETLSGGLYSFEPFVVRARLNPQPAQQWDPQVQSGWFYERDEEYYLYATPVTEYTTGATATLSGVARQGAPIIVKTDEAMPKELRQVSFFDDAASPTSLSLVNQEQIYGTGTTSLYLAYPGVHNVAVVDLTAGATPSLVSTSTSTNALRLTQPTNQDHLYGVTYMVTGSFYADNNYETNGRLATRLVFDSTPQTRYAITYEGSTFNPATPVNLPLSPLYSTMSEGFIFISHDEYTLDRIVVYLSPSKIIADGQDYMLLNVYSQDRYGNPKPNQTFTLSSTFGTFDSGTLTTDRDGYAAATLIAAATTNSLTGAITITGDISTTVNFDIDPGTERGYRLLAAVSAEQIPADGQSQVVIYGKVEDPDFNPVPGAVVKWARARSIYDLFAATPAQSQAIAGVDGTFTIGPFTASDATPGYWFTSLESDSAVPSGSWDQVGDVVFWHEYPNARDGVENMSGLPKPPIQMATPIGTMPPYATPNTWPAYYDEATPWAPATPVTIFWLPPVWFIIRRHHHFQIGLIGIRLPSGHVEVDIIKLRRIRPGPWRIWRL